MAVYSVCSPRMACAATAAPKPATATYNNRLLPSNTFPTYRMSLYYVCFRHVSGVKRPSSRLYTASHVKCNGFGTQWDPIVLTVLLQ